MKSKELYELIELQPEIIEKLEECENQIDLEKIEVLLNQMMNIETAASAYKELKAYFLEDNGNFNMLYCQLECARRIYDKYHEKGISETIFIDTMKCFSRFIGECKAKNGWMFFDRGWWTYRQLSMDIFRIGDLEFQFDEYEGEKAIALHIPSNAKFTEKSVDESLKLAEEFFDEYYPDHNYTKYTCGSWLLSQELKKFLPDNSNIRSFESRFKILHEDKEPNEFIEWLFQRLVNTDYNELPEKTSLQKKVKQYLLKGGKIGEAFGVFDRK